MRTCSRRQLPLYAHMHGTFSSMAGQVHGCATCSSLVLLCLSISMFARFSLRSPQHKITPADGGPGRRFGHGHFDHRRGLAHSREVQCVMCQGLCCLTVLPSGAVYGCSVRVQLVRQARLKEWCKPLQDAAMTLCKPYPSTRAISHASIACLHRSPRLHARPKAQRRIACRAAPSDVFVLDMDGTLVDSEPEV